MEKEKPPLECGGFPAEKLKKRRRQHIRPRLFEVLTELLPRDKRIIDLGAGIGKYTIKLREAGYDVRAVDAGEDVERISKGVVERWDLSVNQPELHGTADWGICIDVGEHVPPDREQTFITNINHIVKEGLFIVWGRPGQKGFGHVNNRSITYVASEFGRRGWTVDDEAIELVQRRIMGRLYRNRILVLRKRVAI